MITPPATPDPPGPLVQKHADGTIWQYVTPPIRGWALLDNNPATVDVVTDSFTGFVSLRGVPGGGVVCPCTYQLHSDGTMWLYTGPPITGWVLLDRNPATVHIAANDGALYQLHRDGTIWSFDGIPITGWNRLDSNPATVAIRAGGCGRFVGCLLFQLHRDGSIWQYAGRSNWVLLDIDPAAVDLTAEYNVYQLHRDGSIWLGSACFCSSGWQLLDNNPATVRIVEDTQGNLYQLHRDGTIWQYSPHAGLWGSNWVLLDNNPAAVGVVAGQRNLYELHRDGTIWHYVGPPIRGWELLDNNPATDLIASDSGNAFIRAPTPGP